MKPELLIATEEKGCHNCQKLRGNQKKCTKIEFVKEIGMSRKVDVPIDERGICELWIKHL